MTSYEGSPVMAATQPVKIPRIEDEIAEAWQHYISEERVDDRYDRAVFEAGFRAARTVMLKMPA